LEDTGILLRSAKPMQLFLRGKKKGVRVYNSLTGRKKGVNKSVTKVFSFQGGGGVSEKRGAI